MIPEEWRNLLQPYFAKNERDFFEIFSFLKKAYAEDEVLPAKHLIFKALELVRPNEVKVVILGQDP